MSSRRCIEVTTIRVKALEIFSCNLIDEVTSKMSIVEPLDLNIDIEERNFHYSILVSATSIHAVVSYTVGPA